jgi:hypothetical protein
MNVEFRMSKECILSFSIKGWSKAIPSFEIRYSIFCGSLFNPGDQGGQSNHQNTCHFGVVSYKGSEVGGKEAQSEGQGRRTMDEGCRMSEIRRQRSKPTSDRRPLSSVVPLPCEAVFHPPSIFTLPTTVNPEPFNLYKTQFRR